MFETQPAWKAGNINELSAVSVWHVLGTPCLYDHLFKIGSTTSIQCSKGPRIQKKLRTGGLNNLNRPATYPAFQASFPGRKALTALLLPPEASGWCFRKFSCFLIPKANGATPLESSYVLSPAAPKGPFSLLKWLPVAAGRRKTHVSHTQSLPGGQRGPRQVCLHCSLVTPSPPCPPSPVHKFLALKLVSPKDREPQFEWEGALLALLSWLLEFFIAELLPLPVSTFQNIEMGQTNSQNFHLPPHYLPTSFYGHPVSLFFFPVLLKK